MQLRWLLPVSKLGLSICVITALLSCHTPRYFVIPGRVPQPEDTLGTWWGPSAGGIFLNRLTVTESNATYATSWTDHEPRVWNMEKLVFDGVVFRTWSTDANMERICIHGTNDSDILLASVIERTYTNRVTFYREEVLAERLAALVQAMSNAAKVRASKSLGPAGAKGTD